MANLSINQSKLIWIHCEVEPCISKTNIIFVENPPKKDGNTQTKKIFLNIKQLKQGDRRAILGELNLFRYKKICTKITYTCY